MWQRWPGILKTTDVPSLPRPSLGQQGLCSDSKNVILIQLACVICRMKMLCTTAQQHSLLRRLSFSLRVCQLLSAAARLPTVPAACPRPCCTCVTGHPVQTEG